MLKNLCLLVLAVVLSGCASMRTTIGEGAALVAAWANTTPSTEETASRPLAPAIVASAPASTASAPAPKPLPVVDVPTDLNTARLMYRAMSGVSLRTRSLDLRPQSVATMQRLCAKGLTAEAVVQDAPESDPQSFGCIRVYVSKSPAMANAPDILVVDAMEMFTRGISAPAEHLAVRQEVELRQELKYQSVRLN